MPRGSGRGGGGRGGGRGRGGAGRGGSGAKRRRNKTDAEAQAKEPKMSREVRRRMFKYGALDDAATTGDEPLLPARNLDDEVDEADAPSAKRFRLHTDAVERSTDSDGDEEVVPALDQLRALMQPSGFLNDLLRRRQQQDRAEASLTLEAVESDADGVEEEAYDNGSEDSEDGLSNAEDGDTDASEAAEESAGSAESGEEEEAEMEDQEDMEEAVDGAGHNEPDESSASRLYREKYQTTTLSESAPEMEQQIAQFTQGLGTATIEASSAAFGRAVVRSFTPSGRAGMTTVQERVPKGAVRSRLRWNELHGQHAKHLVMEGFQAELFGYLSSYRDLVFPQRTFERASAIRQAYVLHALNHVINTRSIVLKSNAKLAANPDLEFRDQGFTRPKVLIVVPYRSEAVAVVQAITDLLINPNASKADRAIHNKKRFYDEFSVPSDIKETSHPNPEYRQYFHGNMDDCFRLGIALKGNAVGLYSPFYSSDIILASPLGLKMVIGDEGDKERDFDFLSSIEVLIFDQCESLLMQNWDHVLHVVQHTNLLPVKVDHADFSRAQHWYLEGWGKHKRQTLLFSSFLFPELRALANRRCFNLWGQLTVARPYKGSITRVVAQTPQSFHRFKVTSAAAASDERFTFFLESVLAEYSVEEWMSVLIFVPSYFDFVRLRNYFHREQLSFTQMCEYTTKGNVSRARNWLYHGERKYALYTERFHYHFRPRLRGIRHVIFYGLPNFAEFYPELLNSIAVEPTTTCTVLYSALDALSLERVVGSQRAEQMLQSYQAVHLYV